MCHFPSGVPVGPASCPGPPQDLLILDTYTVTSLENPSLATAAVSRQRRPTPVSLDGSSQSSDEHVGPDTQSTGPSSSPRRGDGDQLGPRGLHVPPSLEILCNHGSCSSLSDPPDTNDPPPPEASPPPQAALPEASPPLSAFVLRQLQGRRHKCEACGCGEAPPVRAAVPSASLVSSLHPPRRVQGDPSRISGPPIPVKDSSLRETLTFMRYRAFRRWYLGAHEKSWSRPAAALLMALAGALTLFATHTVCALYAISRTDTMIHVVLLVVLSVALIIGRNRHFVPRWSVRISFAFIAISAVTVLFGVIYELVVVQLPRRTQTDGTSSDRYPLSEWQCRGAGKLVYIFFGLQLVAVVIGIFYSHILQHLARYYFLKSSLFISKWKIVKCQPVRLLVPGLGLTDRQRYRELVHSESPPHALSNPSGNSATHREEDEGQHHGRRELVAEPRASNGLFEVRRGEARLRVSDGVRIECVAGSFSRTCLRRCGRGIWTLSQCLCPLRRFCSAGSGNDAANNNTVNHSPLPAGARRWRRREPPRANRVTFIGETDSTGKPDGFGFWREDGNEYGERLVGYWASGLPNGPHKSRELGSGSGFMCIRIGWARFNLTEDILKFGIANVECSVSGKFYRGYPSVTLLDPPEVPEPLSRPCVPPQSRFRTQRTTHDPPSPRQHKNNPELRGAYQNQRASVPAAPQFLRQQRRDEEENRPPTNPSTANTGSARAQNQGTGIDTCMARESPSIREDAQHGEPPSTLEAYLTETPAQAAPPARSAVEIPVPRAEGASPIMPRPVGDKDEVEPHGEPEIVPLSQRLSPPRPRQPRLTALRAAFLQKSYSIGVQPSREWAHATVPPQAERPRQHLPRRRYLSTTAAAWKRLGHEAIHVPQRAGKAVATGAGAAVNLLRRRRERELHARLERRWRRELAWCLAELSPHTPNFGIQPRSEMVISVDFERGLYISGWIPKDRVQEIPLDEIQAEEEAEFLETASPLMSWDGTRRLEEEEEEDTYGAAGAAELPEEPNTTTIVPPVSARRQYEAEPIERGVPHQHNQPVDARCPALRHYATEGDDPPVHTATLEEQDAVTSTPVIIPHGSPFVLSPDALQPPRRSLGDGSTTRRSLMARLLFGLTPRKRKTTTDDQTPTAPRDGPTEHGSTSHHPFYRRPTIEMAMHQRNLRGIQINVVRRRLLSSSDKLAQQAADTVTPSSIAYYKLASRTAAVLGTCDCSCHGAHLGADANHTVPSLSVRDLEAGEPPPPIEEEESEQTAAAAGSPPEVYGPDPQTQKLDTWDARFDVEVPELEAEGWMCRDAAGSPEVLLYIHGYNNSHIESLQILGQMAAFGNYPNHIRLFLFSWPSGSGPFDFFKARKAAEDPRTHQALANVLRIFCDNGIRQLHLLCHSMGSRLFLKSFRSIASTLFQEVDGHEPLDPAATLNGQQRPKKRASGRLQLVSITFLNPEYFLDEFVKDDYNRLRAYCNQITIFADEKDQALWWSEKLSRRPALGKNVFGLWRPTSAAADLLSSLMTVVKQPPLRFVNTVSFFRFNSYSGRRDSLGGDGREEDEERIEWLDVDVIDTTFIDQNVHALRHSFWNLNREIIEDVRDLLVTRKRARQRTGRLDRRDGNVWVYRVAPSFLTSIFDVYL